MSYYLKQLKKCNFYLKKWPNFAHFFHEFSNKNQPKKGQNHHYIIDHNFWTKNAKQVIDPSLERQKAGLSKELVFIGIRQSYKNHVKCLI